MLELQVVFHLLQKDNYTKYRRYVKPSDETKNYFTVLDDLHSSLPGDIKPEEFRASCPDFPLEKLERTPFSVEYMQQALQGIKKRQYAYDVAILAVDVAEGRKPLDELLNSITEVEDLNPVKEDEFVTSSLVEILNNRKDTPSLKFRLQPLQDATGGLRKGNFTFIFARPETGKTTFMASEVSHMAMQTDRPIIWFNNEEDGQAVMMRLYQATLGQTTEQLMISPSLAEKNFLNKTGGRIHLLDDAQMNRRNAEQVIKRLDPGLIIIDQIDKVKGFQADRQDQHLGKIYIWAREIAKSYCPVIGVCQASASAEGKLWLTMEDTADSKTSKAAEADLIIGIGKKNEQGYETLRGLHLLKNKLTGNHARIECKIQPEVARYVGF
jgi:hypothetical protein